MNAQYFIKVKCASLTNNKWLTITDDDSYFKQKIFSVQLMWYLIDHGVQIRAFIWPKHFISLNIWANLTVYFPINVLKEIKIATNKELSGLFLYWIHQYIALFRIFFIMIRCSCWDAANNIIDRLSCLPIGMLLVVCYTIANFHLI